MSNINVSRLGQINQVGLDKELFLKVFANEVLNAFNSECKYQDKQLVRKIEHGRSAQFPVTGRITAHYHTPGSEMLGTRMSHAERVITIDELLVADASIANIDEAMNHYDVRAQYSRQMGHVLAKTYDTNVARVAILAARAAPTITGEQGGSVIIGGANVATDADLFQKAMFSCAQILDEKDVPDTNRYAFVSPVTYYTAAQEPKLLNKDWDGKGSISQGTFETLAGITVVKTNHLPKTNITNDNTVPQKYRGDFSKTAFQVIHESAVGTVKLMDLAMESDYLIRNQATFMVARYAVGHGILRPESAIEVKTTQ